MTNPLIQSLPSLLALCDDDPDALLHAIDSFIIDLPISPEMRSALESLHFTDSDIDSLTAHLDGI